MLTRNELLQFEKNLLTISDEYRVYTNDSPFQSILDAEVLLKNKKSELSSILDDALEQEKSDDIIIQEDDAILQETDEAQIDATDDTVENIEDTEESQEFFGFSLPDKYKSISIDDNEESVQEEYVSDPQEMDILSILPDEKGGEEAKEDITDIDAIRDFNVDEYEVQLNISSVNIHDKQVLQFIKEEFTGKQIQKSNVVFEEEDFTTVYFDEREEVDFFENFKTYNIFLRRAIIEIINTKDDKIISPLITSVIDNASHRYIQRICENALGYSIPLFEDTKIYTFNELFAKLSILSDIVIRATRRLFIYILPRISVFITLFLASYFWVIQPLRAWLLYREGYIHLQNKEYKESESLFVKASVIRYLDGYYFKYAEEYIQQQLYAKAEEKYEQLLFGLNNSLRTYIKQKIIQNDYFKRIVINNKEFLLNDHINYNRQGFLNLISFVRNYQGDNELAINLYNVWLFDHQDDIDFMLGKADTYIDMYDMSLDNQYLTYAKDEYNKVININKYTTKEYIPMLRWAVRSTSAEAQQFIKEIVISRELLDSKSFRLQFFHAYTDAIEYLLQSDYYEFIPPILETLSESFSEYPYFYLLQAKYLFRNKEYGLAQEHFKRSEFLYEQKDVVTLQDIYHIIEMQVLQAEMVLENGNQIIWAEQFLNKAQKMYEEQLDNSIMKRKNDIARLYFYKARFLFFRNDLEGSIQYVRKSLQEQYDTMQVQYLNALINYMQGNWNTASSIFIDLLSLHPEKNENRKVLLVSAANSLFKKENYEAAIVYYTEAIQLQELILRSDEEVSLVDNQLDIFIVEATTAFASLKNNIGVAFFELYQRNHSNKEYFMRASQELQESHTIFQNLNRKDTIRNIYSELPYTNLSILLGNLTSIDMKIFETIATELPNDVYFDKQLAMYTQL